MQMRIPPIQELGLQGIMLILAYFMPIKEMVYAVIFLWAIDWILGVWKSLKAKRTLTSYRFRKSISKITTYVLAITSTYVLENTFLPEWIPICKVVAGYISFTELVSIYENMSEITGKKLMLELLDVVKRNMHSILKPK